MNLIPIINARLLEKQEKEAQVVREKEEKITREKQRLALNAEVVKRVFSDVVEPVLNTAKLQIVESGQECRVETTSVAMGDAITPIGIRLGLILSPKTLYLNFEGSFNSVTVEVSENTRGGIGIMEPAIPVEGVTTKFVEARVESFIEKAFSN